MLGVMAGIAWTRPQGAFAEVGVYKGGSARVLYQIAMEQGRQLYLYDTFSGMPFQESGLDSHKVGEFADCSYEDVRSSMPNAMTIKGVFPSSAVQMAPVAFVHADADQYQSTQSICSVFAPIMVLGGAILFDDYRSLRGCIKAVDEFFPNREVLPDGRALVRFT